MVQIIVTLIRPKLEYAAIVWPTWLKKDMRKHDKYRELQLKWFQDWEISHMRIDWRS